MTEGITTKRMYESKIQGNKTKEEGRENLEEVAKRNIKWYDIGEVVQERQNWREK